MDTNISSKSRHAKNGFTLVEIIIALAILVIVAVPIVNSFRQSAKTNQESRHLIEANQVAQTVMEEVKNRLKNGEDLSSYAPGLTTGLTPANPWDVSTYPLAKRTDDSDAGAVNFASGSTDLYNAGEWESFNKDKSYIVKCTVTKGSATSESNANVETYPNKVNATTLPYGVSTSTTEASGSERIMNLEVNESGGKIHFINNSNGIGEIGNITPDGVTDSVTLNLKYNVTPAEKTTINVINNYKDARFNFIVSDDPNENIGFETASSSAYLNPYINRDDIMNSSEYATASTQIKSSAQYTINIKVCRKDDINWSDPIVNLESGRAVRK